MASKSSAINTMIIYSIIFLFFLIFVAGAWTIQWQHKQLSRLKNKADKFYHDINSSLVITKLTIESLKDWSIKNKNTPSAHDDLLNILEEGVSQIELSFRHWDNCIK